MYFDGEARTLSIAIGEICRTTSHHNEFAFIDISIVLKYQLENAAKLKVTNIALVFRLYQDAEV